MKTPTPSQLIGVSLVLGSAAGVSASAAADAARCTITSGHSDRSDSSRQGSGSCHVTDSRMNTSVYQPAEGAGRSRAAALSATRRNRA